MRVRTFHLIMIAFALGCTTSNMDKHAANGQGLAELRVDPGSLITSSITRVTVEAAGESQDLTLNPIAGTFDGSLMLPIGTQSLVVRAFSNEALVGQSQPTPVDIQSGVVTRVMVRILDLTGETPPVYGPIFESLSFPTATRVGVPANFTISVIAPAGDPVTYAWSSNCPDSMFSVPDAATTGWSNPAEGACTITVTATSNGFTVARNFMVVVFAAESETGAVTVNGTFVGAPSIAISLAGVNCTVFPGSNASCPDAIASPATSTISASVLGWGASSTPGTLELSDDCGGRFGVISQSQDFRFGAWLPPPDGQVCIVTARATNGDGVIGATSAAVLVRPGAPATSQPPLINAGFPIGCPPFSSPPVDCEQFPVGFLLRATARVDFLDGLPGTVSIMDDCAGPLPAPTDLMFFGAMWNVPNQPGRSCTTTVRATSLQGSTSEVSGRYVIGP